MSSQHSDKKIARTPSPNPSDTTGSKTQQQIASQKTNTNPTLNMPSKLRNEIR